MKLLLLFWLFLGSGVASGVEPPLVAGELAHLPLLEAEIDRGWVSIPCRSCLAAQVRQETCAGLKSKRCWSPYAELKTNREYGFGLGQITVTSRFDNFVEVKKLDPSLQDWVWENRYNATYQLRALVLLDKFNYGKISGAASEFDRLAFAFAAYNGGLGGVISDRAVCRSVLGCIPGVWFGQVERTSKKAKVTASGYGKSFYEINREYVRHIMLEYPVRYHSFFGEGAYVPAY